MIQESYMENNFMGLLSNLFSSEPDLENFTTYQMKRHVESLYNWIDRHDRLLDPSDSIKAELRNKQDLYDKAMAVWKRRLEDGSI